MSYACPPGASRGEDLERRSVSSWQEMAKGVPRLFYRKIRKTNTAKVAKNARRVFAQTLRHGVIAVKKNAPSPMEAHIGRSDKLITPNS